MLGAILDMLTSTIPTSSSTSSSSYNVAHRYPYTSIPNRIQRASVQDPMSSTIVPNIGDTQGTAVRSSVEGPASTHAANAHAQALVNAVKDHIPGGNGQSGSEAEAVSPAQINEEPKTSADASLPVAAQNGQGPQVSQAKGAAVTDEKALEREKKELEKAKLKESRLEAQRKEKEAKIKAKEDARLKKIEAKKNKEQNSLQTLLTKQNNAKAESEAKRHKLEDQIRALEGKAVPKDKKETSSTAAKVAPVAATAAAAPLVTNAAATPAPTTTSPSAPPTVERSTLATLSHQVAGHEAGVYTVGDGSLVVKSGLPTEAAFYNSVLLEQSKQISKSQRALLNKLSRYLPTYHGSVDIVDGQTKPTRAVVLENLTHGYKHASVLDIKLGKQLWDESASAEKRARMEEAAKTTTSGKTGIRLTGWQAWDSETNAFVKVGKGFGKSISVDQLGLGVRSFFGLGSSEDAKVIAQHVETPIAPVHEPVKAVERILNDAVLPAVKEIQDILKRLEWRVRGGSLLIIYEGDAETLRSATSKSFPRCGRSSNQTDKLVKPSEFGSYKTSNTAPRLVDVRLIDFAHATLTPGKGNDVGVLAGISTTRDLLEKLAKDARKGRVGSDKPKGVKETVNEAIVSIVEATDIAASRKSDAEQIKGLTAEPLLTTAPIVAAAGERAANHDSTAEKQPEEGKVVATALPAEENVAAESKTKEIPEEAGPQLPTTAPIVAAAASKIDSDKSAEQDAKGVPTRPAKAKARDAAKDESGSKSDSTEKPGLLATIFGRRKSYKGKDDASNVDSFTPSTQKEVTATSDSEKASEHPRELSSTEEAGLAAIAGTGATVGAGAILLAADSDKRDEDKNAAKESEEQAQKEKSEAEAKAAEEHKAAEESKAAAEKALAEKKAAETKAASEHEAAQVSRAAEEKALAEKKTLEQKLEAEQRAAEESKKALLEKEAADKKATEERHALEAAAAAAAAEKLAAEKKAADEKRAAEEQAEAEKKRADEERKAAEAKLEAEKKRAADEKAALEKQLAEERKAAEKKVAEEHKAAEKRIAEEHKAAEKQLEAEKKKAAEEKAELEKKTAEEKKTAAAVAAAELKAAQDAKKEDQKRAAEEKAALEKKTAEEKKTAAAVAAAELKAAQDAKKEEKKRAAEEKAALEKKTAEERKTAAAVAAAELKAAQDAKKEAQKLQQQQAKDAKKAEQEARKLKEDLAKQKKKAEKEAQRKSTAPAEKRKSRFSALFATPIGHNAEPSSQSAADKSPATKIKSGREGSTSVSGAPAGGTLSTLAPQEVEDQRREADQKNQSGVSALLSPLLKRNDSDAQGGGPSFSAAPAGAEETSQGGSKGLERKISEKVHHGGLFGLSKKGSESEDTTAAKTQSSAVEEKKHDSSKETAAAAGVGVIAAAAATAPVVAKEDDEEEKPQTPAKDAPTNKEGETGFFGGLVRKRTQKNKEAPPTPSKDQKAIHADAIKAHEAAQQAKAEAEKARSEAKKAREEAERAHAEVLKVQAERAKAVKEKEKAEAAAKEVEKAKAKASQAAEPSSSSNELKRGQSQKRKSGGLAIFGFGGKKTEENSAKDLPQAPAKKDESKSTPSADAVAPKEVEQTLPLPSTSKKSSVDGSALDAQIPPEILAAIVTDEDKIGDHDGKTSNKVSLDKKRISVDRTSRKSANENKSAPPPLPDKEQEAAKSAEQQRERPLGRMASLWHGKGAGGRDGRSSTASTKDDTSNKSNPQHKAGAIVEEVIEETERGTQKLIRVTNPPRGAGRAPSAVQWREPK